MNNNIDTLVEEAVFSADSKARGERRQAIRSMAAQSGVIPASIQGLYDAAGKGAYHNRTVPAINIRGITYPVARAVFRAAMENKVGAFIFEIARSEIGYTEQKPDEYAVCVLAAAVKEKFSGPVFIQGDHFQVNRKRYGADPAAEVEGLRALMKEAIAAGFLNIDIDASTIVDIEKPDLRQQQEKNCLVTAELTKFIRSTQPEGVMISVGGEIGEVGKQNSTVADLRAFMSGYLEKLGKGVKGISKISVQTGTRHGGVVLPDGSIASVKIDFKTLEELSRLAREEYGMGGAVQHGASTLPDEAFELFPRAGTVEVHLATGFQNIIYDSPRFPADLKDRIRRYLAEKFPGERKEGQTDEQFFYENRKRAFGPFKKEFWSLPEPVMQEIMGELEERFVLLFEKLNVTDTVGLVKKHVSLPKAR